VDDVASAIADPVRREILVLLRGGPQTAGAVAARFPISRPAVSRHLRVLREAGLVADTTEGRERVYRLDVAPLADLDAWLAPFRPAPGVGDGWDARFDALATEVHRTRRERRAAGGQAPISATDTDTRADAEERTA
jgi:DNA-binding transcriptional ArsR family regulator